MGEWARRFVLEERRLEFPFVGLTLAALIGGIASRWVAPGAEGAFWVAA